MWGGVVVGSDLWLIDCSVEVPEWEKFTAEVVRFLENIGSCLVSDHLAQLPLLLRSEPMAQREVSVALVSDAEIHLLNANHRGKDKPTDVLSFPLLDPPQLHSADQPLGFSGILYLGDIVISMDTALRQADEYQCLLIEELKRLLVHGVLHLLGFDHEDVPEEEAERMRLLEAELLIRCGAVWAVGE